MNKFNINTNRPGEAKEAYTAENVRVTRHESLFVPEYANMVTCAPYDEHFIYENPSKAAQSPAYLCTCGSIAGIVPPGPGGMFVCIFHATYQAHQTTFVNKKDFLKEAAEPERKRIRKAPRKWQ